MAREGIFESFYQSYALTVTHWEMNVLYKALSKANGFGKDTSLLKLDVKVVQFFFNCFQRKGSVSIKRKRPAFFPQAQCCAQRIKISNAPLLGKITPFKHPLPAFSSDSVDVEPNRILRTCKNENDSHTLSVKQQL